MKVAPSIGAMGTLVGSNPTPIAPRTVGIHQILVAVDLEDTSKRALELGLALAESLDAGLTLVHVWEVPPYPYTSMASSIVRRAVEEAARAGLDALLAEAKARVPRVTGVLKHGIAWREIVETAERIGADLLILETHGRRGVPGALLGSVADKVVRMSPVPVLTTPSAAP